MFINISGSWIPSRRSKITIDENKPWQLPFLGKPTGPSRCPNTQDVAADTFMQQTSLAFTDGSLGVAFGLLQLEAGLSAGPDYLQQCRSTAAHTTHCQAPQLDRKRSRFWRACLTRCAEFEGTSAMSHHERHWQEVDPVLLQPRPVVGRRRLLLPPTAPSSSLLGAWACLLRSLRPCCSLRPPLPCTSTHSHAHQNPSRAKSCREWRLCHPERPKLQGI